MAFTNNSLHGGHPIGIPRDFLGNAKHFRLVRKCIYRIFFNVNHPNDSLIMKFIDQIMGLCIKKHAVKIMAIFYSVNAKMHAQLGLGL